MGERMNNEKEIERQRLVRLAEIRSIPLCLSPTHRPGTLGWIFGWHDDTQTFTCPGCGALIVSSFDYMWGGIDCETCGCRFATLDDDAYLWDFEQLPTKDVTMKESQQGWSPNDHQSPYYVWHMMTDTEWLVVSREYPYSVRVLVHRKWSEHGRTQTEEQANILMQGLARLHSNKDWWVGWIVTKSTCVGQEVWEKPVLWYPSETRIREELHQAGFLKIGL